MKEKQEIDPLNSISNKEDKQKAEYFWHTCAPQKEKTVIDSIRLKTFRKITCKEKSKTSLRLLFVSISVAASIFLILGITKWVEKDTTKDMRVLAQQMTSHLEKDAEQVTLIASEEKFLLKESTQIKYDNQGTLTIDEEKVAENREKEEEVTQYNQLIVPKGKRSRLLLSDGTEVFVNSGTKVIYPRIFHHSKREIYVDGEIYLHVTPDPARPFFVTTPTLEVKVLGTSFNIFSYGHLSESQVVLVEGSVELKDVHNESVVMKPNELVLVKDKKLGEKREVDAQIYKSWIYGIWVVEGITLAQLSERLSLYYGKTIHCDASISNEQIYGKLDLRENIEEIIHFIQTILPLQTEVKGDNIRFYRE